MRVGRMCGGWGKDKILSPHTHTHTRMHISPRGRRDYERERGDLIGAPSLLYNNTKGGAVQSKNKGEEGYHPWDTMGEE